MASRDEFDYAAYAESRGYTGLPEGRLEEQGAKDLLYREFIQLAYDDYQKQNNLGKSQADHRKTVAALEELAPDTRWALDIPQARTREQQLDLLKPKAFASYLEEVGARPEDELSLHYDKYHSIVTNNEWENPLVWRNAPRGLSPEASKSYLVKNTERFGTVGNLFQATRPKPEPQLDADGQPVTTETGAAEQEEQGLGDTLYETFISPTRLGKAAIGALKGAYDIATDEQVSSGFERSGYTSAMADGARELFSTDTTGLRQRESTGGVGPSNEMRLEISDTVELNDEELQERKLQAAQKIADNFNKREAIPVAPNLVKLMQSKGLLEAGGNVSVEVAAELLAEGGQQMLDELAASTAGFFAGAAAGSAVPVIGTTAGGISGAAAAGGATAGRGASADHMAQEAVEELIKRKLPVTAENLVKLTEDEAWVTKTREDADKIGLIAGTGTAASTVAGGIINAQILRGMGSLARRASTTVDNVVYRGTTTGQQLGAAAVAATTAGVIDYNTAVAEKAVVGETLSDGEKVALGVISAGSAGLDLTTGALAGTRNASGPIEISKGQTYFQPDGAPVTVLDGDQQGNISVQDLDGNETVMQAQEIAQLSTVRPIQVVRPTPQEAAEARSQLNPVTVPTEKEGPLPLNAEQQAGYDLLSLHINDLSDEIKMPDNFWVAINEEMGDTDLTQVASSAGAVLTTDRKDSNALLTQGFVDSGAIVRTPNRGYEPADAENQTQIVMAAIANRAQAEENLVPAPEPVAVTSMVGQTVEYQGVTGLLVERDDGLYVVTGQGDVLVESGLSGQPAESLGISFTDEADFDAIYRQGTRGVTSNWDTSEFTVRDKQYQYLRTNSDTQTQDGLENPTVSITAVDSQGNEVTFTDPVVVNELEAQKIEHELRGYDDAAIQSAIDADPEVHSQVTQPRSDRSTADQASERNQATTLEEITTDPETEYTLAADGGVFKTKEFAATTLLAREIDGSVIPVEGGYAIRHTPLAEPVPEVADANHPFKTVFSATGKYVDYQGVEGFLVKESDGLYVYGEAGRTLVESGLSGQNLEELGITVKQINFDEVYSQNPVFDDVVADFDTNEVLLDGEVLIYQRTESDEQGVTNAIVLQHPEDGEVRITDPELVADIEAQKITQELEKDYGTEEQWEAIRAVESNKAVQPVVTQPEPEQAGATTEVAEPTQSTGTAETGVVGNIPVKRNPDGKWRDSRYNTGIVYEDSQVTVTEPDPTIQADARPAQSTTQPTAPKRNVSSIAEGDRAEYARAVRGAMSSFESTVWGSVSNDVRKGFEGNPATFTALTTAELSTLAKRIKNSKDLKVTVKEADLDSVTNALRTIQVLHTIAPDQFTDGAGDRLKAYNSRKRAVTKQVKEAFTAVEGKRSTRTSADDLKEELRTVHKFDEGKKKTQKKAKDLAGDNATLKSPLHVEVVRQRVLRALEAEGLTPPKVEITRPARIPDTVVNKIPPAPTTMRVVSSTDLPMHIVTDTDNFMDEGSLQRLADEGGYKVTPIYDNDDVQRLSGAHLEKAGREMVTITSKGNPNPASKKDRKYTVTVGGELNADGELRGGRALKSKYWSGNKNFRVPGEIIPVTDTDTATDAAIAIGLNQSDVKRTKTSAEFTRDGVTAKFTFNEDGTTTAEINGVTTTSKVDAEGNTIEAVGVELEAQPTPAMESLAQSKRDIEAGRAMGELREAPTPTLTERQAVSHPKRVDELDSPQTYTAVEGSDKARLEVGGSIEVHIDGKDINPDEVRRTAALDSYSVDESTIYMDIEDADALYAKNRGGRDYSVTDVRRLIKQMFSPHIARMVNLHETADNPAAEQNTWGFFSFNYNNNGPSIHVDVQPGKRDLHGVLSTISEEVGHFSWDSWTTGASRPFIQKFYDTAWKHFGADAMNDMTHYVDRYQIDIDNPDPDHQAVLLNEYFSKQGMSIVGFTDEKVSPPKGLSRAEVDEISDAAHAAMDGVESSLVLTEIDLDTLGDMTPRDLATIILKAQVRAIKPRSTVFKYTSGDRILTVRPTPFGRVMVYGADTDEALAYTRIKESIYKGDTTKPHSEKVVAAKKSWWRNNIFGNKIMNRHVQRAVATGTVVDEAATNLRIKNTQTLALRVEAAFRDAGITPKFHGSYVETFARYNLDSKRLRKLATQADAALKALQHESFEGSEAIRNEGAEDIMRLRTHAEQGDVPPALIGQMMGIMESVHREFRADYQTTIYKVHTDPHQKQVLRRMKQFLAGGDTGGKNLYEQYKDAKVVLDKMNAEGIKNPKKRQPYEETIDTYDRLESLYTAYAYRNDIKTTFVDRNQTIMTYVNSKLDDLLGEGTGDSKADTMQSVRKKTKLDADAPDTTYDYHMRKFLAVETDPLKVAVASTAKQKETLRRMRADGKMVDGIMRSGAGDIVGSPALGRGATFDPRHRGSSREFLVVDNEMKIEIERAEQLQEEIDTRFVSAFIGFAKTTSTVMGLRLITNFYGIPHILGSHGHLFRIGKMRKSMRSIKEAWKQRTGPASNKEIDAYAVQIVQELRDGDALGTIVDMTQVDIRHAHNIVQKVAKAAFETGEVAGLSEERSLSGQAVIDSVMKTTQDIYGFPDDIPKLLSYMINREMMVLKHESKLKRSDYNSDQEYRDHVEKLAVRDAVDRTRRENPDYALIPEIPAQISKSNFRLFTGDFFLHNFQSGRMMAETARIGKEDWKEWQRAKDEGHTEYAKELRTMLAARTVGAGVMFGGIAFRYYLGWTVASYVTTGIASMAMEAYEEVTGEEVENRASMDQVHGMNNALAHMRYADSVKYEASPVKIDQWTWETRAFDQLSPYYIAAPLPKNSTDIDRGEQFVRGLRRLMISDSETMSIDLIQAWIAKNYRGDNLEWGSKEHINELQSIMQGHVRPGLMRTITELVTGEDVVTGKAKPRAETMKTLSGIRHKRVDVRDLMSQVGADMYRDYSNRQHTRSFIEALRKGDESFTAGSPELAALIARDRQENYNMASTYAGFFHSMHRAGYSGDDIIKYTSSNRKHGAGISKKSRVPVAKMEEAYRGGNIFDSSTVTKLENVLKDVSGDSVSKTFTQERKDQAIKNLEYAIAQYKMKLNTGN